MLAELEQRIQRAIDRLLPEPAPIGTANGTQTLAERLIHYHTPGVSIAVINHFAIDWARGFGLCEAGTTRAVTPTTIFQAASISKPIFALAVIRLARIGVLSLDEDINCYLTSWRVSEWAGGLPRLTLRQLLSHKAGLNLHGFPGYSALDPLPTTIQVLNGEFPANTEPVAVNLPPGSQCRYSGGGTMVAQQVLVDLLGKPFPEIMAELVLDPLGLINSTYQQPLIEDWQANVATAHREHGIPVPGNYHIYPEMAAAGLWTTPTDLAKIGVELMQVLQGKPSPLWSKETIEAMLRVEEVGEISATTGRFGLGWMVGGTGEQLHFFHSGWNEGFVSIMRVYPQIGKGAVVMINSNEGYPLLAEIIRSIAQEDDWGGSKLFDI